MDSLSEIKGEPMGSHPTIWEGFSSHAESIPDALALGSIHQPPGLFGTANIALDDETYRRRPYLRWSFRTLHDGILQLTKSLTIQGVKEGATVVTFLQNGAEYAMVA